MFGLKKNFCWPNWGHSTFFGSDLGGALYLRICLSVSPGQNFLILTLELNNSAPDHLIELKFGTLNHLRMYIMMLMLEQLSSAVNSYFSHHDRRKSMLEASYAKVCFAKCSGNCLEMNFEY